MKITNGLASRALLAATVASTMMLSACGGGGSNSASAIDGSSVPPPKFACTGIPGATDAARAQILDALVPQLGAIPTAGQAVQQLIVAVAQLLDVVDAVANGLQALAQTRDTAQLTGTVENAAAALRCALGPVSGALSGIEAQLPAGTAIPAIGNADALLVQLAALLDGKLGNGPGAGLPAGLDVVVVRTLLQQINVRLATVATQVQARLPANTPIAPAIDLLSVVLVDVQRVFGRIAVLDDAGIADSITFLVTDVSSRLTTTMASSFGVPNASVLGPQLALNNAMATVGAQLGGITAVVLSLLHGSLMSALGPLLGLIG